MDERSVIREKQKSFRILVKTPGRRKVAPGSRTQKAEDGRLVRILRRRKHAGRLIHQDIFEPAVGDRLSIKRNEGLRHNRGPGILHPDAVHRHAAFADRLPHFTARAEAHVG